VHRNFSHTQKIKENKKKKKVKKKIKRFFIFFYFFSVFLSAKKYGALSLILDFVPGKFLHMSLPPPG
jgi:signal recognition particle GTPase